MPDHNSALRSAHLHNAVPPLSKAQKAFIKAIYHEAKCHEPVFCTYCGEPVPKKSRHVDHIIPFSRGGLHVPENLAISCARCNLRKRGKLPGEMTIQSDAEGPRQSSAQLREASAAYMRSNSRTDWEILRAMYGYETIGIELDANTRARLQALASESDCSEEQYLCRLVHAAVYE